MLALQNATFANVFYSFPIFCKKERPQVYPLQILYMALACCMAHPHIYAYMHSFIHVSTRYVCMSVGAQGKMSKYVGDIRDGKKREIDLDETKTRYNRHSILYPQLKPTIVHSSRSASSFKDTTRSTIHTYTTRHIQQLRHMQVSFQFANAGRDRAMYIVQLWLACRGIRSVKILSERLFYPVCMVQ